MISPVGPVRIHLSTEDANGADSFLGNYGLKVPSLVFLPQFKSTTNTFSHRVPASDVDKTPIRLTAAICLPPHDIHARLSPLALCAPEQVNQKAFVDEHVFEAFSRRHRSPLPELHRRAMAGGSKLGDVASANRVPRSLLKVLHFQRSLPNANVANPRPQSIAPNVKGVQAVVAEHFANLFCVHGCDCVRVVHVGSVSKLDTIASKKRENYL